MPITLDGTLGITTPTYGGADTAEYLVPVTAFKNRIINSQGLINQRGYVSGTATTGANQYTVDRWRVVTSGQNLTFTTTANVTTFTAPAGGVEEVIEGLNLESGTYVLGWTGTATATVGGTSIANGGSIAVTGGTNLTIRFSNGTFSLPQFERGTTATSFDYRPYGTELALCQRYYQTFGGGSFIGTPSSSTTGVIYATFSVIMRANPTLSISSGTLSYNRPWIGAFTATTNSADLIATNYASIAFSGATGLTVGTMVSNNYIIGASAEL